MTILVGEKKAISFNYNGIDVYHTGSSAYAYSLHPDWDMYKDFETEFTKHLNIDTNDYYISNLDNFSNDAMHIMKMMRITFLTKCLLKLFTEMTMID